MRVVIDIPDKEYECVQITGHIGNATQVSNAILNGTPFDKIRERISLEKLGYPPSAGYYKAIMKALQIIDKYKAESEDE